jgi:peptidoglycan hydrolase-like protein with peptidoglycan-binding domain
MPTPSDAVNAMVAAAEHTLGMGESPDNTNAITRWYGMNGEPWCNMAITYWAYQSGNQKAVCFDGKYAYTPAHAQAFRDRGQWTYGATGIQRGDIVFFDWGNRDSIAAIDHVGVVTHVLGDDVHTIEGNTLNTVARRVRHAPEIAGYGRPKYAGTPAPTPAPTPGGTVPYTAPPFPAGLRPNSASPSAKGLQKALKDAGYMSKTIAYSDNYGPSTQAAVAAFHKANPSLSDGGYDPIIGPMGWAELHREAYGGASKPPPTPAPPTDDPVYNEPAHDYRRVTYGGKTVNVRTQVLLKRAQAYASRASEYKLTQGSYNRGVGASAGTHDGGGVVDINTNGLNVNATLLALRKAGFAAWYRTPAEGFAPHIHAAAIGDREMASSARNQVAAYFNGRNGLANGRADSAPASVGRPYPKWAARYR